MFHNVPRRRVRHRKLSGEALLRHHDFGEAALDFLAPLKLPHAVFKALLIHTVFGIDAVLHPRAFSDDPL